MFVAKYALCVVCIMLYIQSYWLLQGSRIGVFTKDNFTGDFVDGWKKVLEDASFEMVRYPSYTRAVQF